MIAGPGGPYVAAAKDLVRHRVGVDFEAGPSEVLVLALDDFDPDLAAADLISEGEHGATSCGLVVTPDAGPRGARPRARLEARLALPAERRDAVLTQLAEGRSGIVVTADADAAVAFCEEVAPEHVIVHARDADAVARSLRCAGTVCIGAFTPSPAGSYVAGTNHVLPTGGAARHSAGLSVTHFVRRQSFERITRDGLERLRPSIEAWATYEGLPGHLAAIDARLRRVDDAAVQRMTIYGVSFDLVGKQPIVLLKTADGNRFLPIWIGHPEAAAILQRLQGDEVPRPMTHDLFVTCSASCRPRSSRSPSRSCARTRSTRGSRCAGTARRSRSTRGPATRSRSPCAATRPSSRPTTCRVERDRDGGRGARVRSIPETQIEEFKHFLDDVRPDDFAG